MRLSHEEVKKRIVDELYWDSRVDASEVSIDFADDRAVLRGTVPSHAARRAAENDAIRVAGVRHVENQLIVSYAPTVPVPSDAEIAAYLRSALNWDATIDASAIMVSAVDGDVSLEGSVDAYWKKLRIEDLAYDMIGVITVSNKLAVVPTRDLEDQAIAEDMVAALDRSALIDVESVDVEVEDGIVTLTGTVPSWMAWDEAQRAAQYTEGVVDVINDLTIVS